ncbi:hypothetical protein DICVIV_13817 [Dictyocaulus viviparus]|uniref:Uncharacterized protein n=1 Tax=Dictyocaulus viviparus TaxID=29172 RepID=A0A0D8X926_DICVI|nr:hypothetical protein DICVIV_13817 [Dictyocaulus viviparus]
MHPALQTRVKSTLVAKDNYRSHHGRKTTLRKSLRLGNEPCMYLPAMLKCTKCGEEIGSGLTFNTVLSHVQKAHLKIAAFQCRICKHYRTTHERIQSHVTTVHKARSTKFDSSLAGPISTKDMQLMEKMISICFPGVRVKLEITDRLSIGMFEYNGVKT